MKRWIGIFCAAALTVWAGRTPAQAQSLLSAEGTLVLQRVSDQGYLAFDNDRYLSAYGARLNVALPGLPKDLKLNLEYARADQRGSLFGSIQTRIRMHQADAGLQYSLRWTQFLPETPEWLAPVHRLGRILELSALADAQLARAEATFSGNISRFEGSDLGVAFRLAAGPSLVLPKDLVPLSVSALLRYHAGYRSQSDLKLGRPGTLSIGGLFHSLSLGIYY
ncbi:MAG: hypothetical protein HYT87_13840 [Nitrospirae bacterium]|nr:hypothetical protein [Nitrospirota bacterium]